MKTLKQNPTAVPGRPEAHNTALSQSVTRRRRPIRHVAVCAVLLQFLASTRAAEVPPVQEPGNKSAQVPPPEHLVQGREMERYKAFARQADLPSMAVTTNVLIEVGGSLKLDVTRVTQLSVRDKEALARQLSVPVGVVDRVVQRVATNSLPSTDQLVQELHTAVVDYKFLQIEWERFHPPAEGQQIKSNALSALQDGDLAKAWELYDGLGRPEPPGIAKPAPPTNLRIVGGQ